MELTETQRREEAGGFVEALAGMVQLPAGGSIETVQATAMEPTPKESFRQFTARLSDLFTERELAETEDDRKMYDDVIRGVLSVEMSNRVDALAAIITKGEAWSGEATRLQEVARRHEANALRLKAYVLDVMLANGIKELKAATSRLLVAGNGGLQPLEVDEDISQLSPEFKRVTLVMSGAQYLRLVSSSASTTEAQTILDVTVREVAADHAAIRLEMSKQCPKCGGTGRPAGTAESGVVRSTTTTQGDTAGSATTKADVPAEKCSACLGSGKRGVSGARLLQRGKHLRVEGSYLQLESE